MMMPRISTAAFDRLRDKHPAIAECIESGRSMDAMRAAGNVIDLKTVTLFRERRRAAHASYQPQAGGTGGPAFA